MSVLIKGMKKPKDCYSCPFAHNGWPDEWEMHCLFLDRQVGYFGKKLKVPKDCPIVEIPTPAQPETAKRIVGKSRGSTTLWYQCDMCNEPVDAQDNFCRGCGRRLIDGENDE